MNPPAECKQHEAPEETSHRSDRRDGEDNDQLLARASNVAALFEATWPYLDSSGDDKQPAASNFHRVAVTAR